MIAVPHIMKYVEKILNSKAGIETETPVGAAQPKTEAVKVAAPVAKVAATVAKVPQSETLQEKYARLLKKNQPLIAVVRPRPHSRAYDSLNLNKNSTTVDEEAKNQQSYQTDKAQLAVSKSHYVHKALRQAMIDSGIFSTNDANAKMKQIEE